jgi:hypothetical protein
MDRTSCGKNVVCGIDVTIMLDATLRAGPGANIKRKGLEHMTAIKAPFGGRGELVNFDEGSAQGF